MPGAPRRVRAMRSIPADASRATTRAVGAAEQMALSSAPVLAPTSATTHRLVSPRNRTRAAAGGRITGLHSASYAPVPRRSRRLRRLAGAVADRFAPSRGGLRAVGRYLPWFLAGYEDVAEVGD